jgi:outer membrane protein TolC
MPSGPSSAVRVQPTGPGSQQDPVGIGQQNSGGTSSSVTVQGSYTGSVPTGTATSGTLQITLADALERGLKQNLAAVTQSEQVLQAGAQRRIARSSLLPTVNTEISEEVERLNLRTQGVLSSSFPLTAQLNFFDARAARVRQTIFDFVQLENLHSATQSLVAAVQSSRDSRDLIVLAVSGSYLQIIAANSRVAAASAEVNTDRTIYQQAADRLAAGLDALIDVTRSQVQLQTDQQRLRSTEADVQTQKLRFSRLIGLPAGQSFVVAEEFRFSPLTGVTLESALQTAYQQRSDLHAAEASTRAAEIAVKAAHAERLPNLTLNADWGAAGLRPTAEAHSVYSVYGTLTIPLYEGGRTQADIDQATSALRSRQAEMSNVRGKIDEDVRQAFIDLNEAADQVSVADSNVKLAHETLAQAKDRFTAGISDTVELVQAEQAVAEADNAYISAVFRHNLAKVALARAMGDAERSLPSLLRK